MVIEYQYLCLDGFLFLKELSRLKTENKKHMEEIEKAREQLILRDKLLEVWFVYFLCSVYCITKHTVI